MRRGRRGAIWLVLASVVAVWLLACIGFARGLESLLLGASPPLRAERVAQLRVQVASSPGASPVAIVVLGGGAEPYAPEYDSGSLEAASLERLRYGLWLARRTGAPVAFSGGRGWAGRPGVPEADLAQRIATEDFRQPLRWVENTSRDTRENADHSVRLLSQAGVRHIVLVTHGWHMQRARALFEAAASSSGIGIEPAPMGLAEHTQLPVLDWLPSSLGFKQSRQVIREWLGWRLGA
jgi:uncharacterized SAM-binding protein YcdF (DUF218 family)